MKSFSIIFKCSVALFVILLQCDEFHSYGVTFGNIGRAAGGAAVGFASTAPKAILTPEEFFELSKNVFAGYPFDAAFRIINTFCAAALSASTVKPRFLPKIDEMSFVLKTRKTDVSVQLEHPEQLWASAEFKKNLPLVLLITGWTTNLHDTNNALDAIYAAYDCRGGVNFVVVDAAAYVDTLYSWSAFNTEEIGRLIADALEQLIRKYPINKIHIIGHSLGAHIAGAAGRHLFHKTGKMVPRITGLDPANPCFNEGESLTGLSRGDADFVDVIHSDPGALGKRDSIGDADFYPNGVAPLPPGCVTITCAHGRAWEYYAESVYPGNEQSFLAVKCRSLSALTDGYCTGRETPMGYAASKILKGNYMLKTNAVEPFGLKTSKDVSHVCAK